MTPQEKVVFDYKKYNADREKYILETKHGLPITQLTLFEGIIDKYPMRGVCDGTIIMYNVDGIAAGDPIWNLQMINIDKTKN